MKKNIENVKFRARATGQLTSKKLDLDASFLPPPMKKAYKRLVLQRVLAMR